jgi:hypothetical protein
MKTLSASLAMLTLVIGGVQAAQPVEMPLKFVKAPGSFCGEQRAKISLRPPSGRFKMPKFRAARPLYITMKLGDSHYLAVADFSSSESGWYDCLYVDANRNGDLTDDKVIEPKVLRSIPGQPPGPDLKVSEFDVAGVTMVKGGKSTPYFFTSRLLASGLQRVNLQTMSEVPATMHFAIISACHYTGTLRVGGVDCQVLLADSNGNGTFHDIPNPVRSRGTMRYHGGDRLYLCDRAGVGHRDGAMLCSRIAVGPDLYQVEIDTAAKLLRLKPDRGAVGYLKIPFQAQNIVLWGEKIPFVAFMAQDKIPVPVGRYRVSSYVYAKKHGLEHWRLTASFVSKPAVTVAARSTASLEIGEAYRPCARVKNEKKGFSFWISRPRGVGDELVEYVERGITRSNFNGRLIKPPTYEVFSNGHRIGGGKFRYG